jgi:predicted amidophosphoribosyltransferase
VELAKCISKQLEIPLNYRACKRIKNTLPQTSLNWEQRQVNLQGAFKVTYIDPQWQHIVLIDDVMTTGNTVAELARVFKEAGIQRVDVWCCARAIGYTHAKEWWSQRRAEGNDCGETN